MKVSDIGQFGLIDMLSKMVSASRTGRSASWRDLVQGIGDDAAAWKSDGSIQLAHVDAIVQDVHFKLSETPLGELGWKALAINLSDIAAMGGVPRYALVSLTLPPDTEVEEVVCLYKGMLELAQRFEVAIVGGHISSAATVSVTITIMGNSGKPDREYLMTRSSAKPGDKIAVTGNLGTAAAGLRMLLRHLSFATKDAAFLKEAFLKPMPRVAEGQQLLKLGVRTAMDISDGIASDLGHICRASGVGARVEVDKAPVHEIVNKNFGEEALDLALAGGEDYELLFCAGYDLMDKVKKALACPVTVIGEIVAEHAGKVEWIKDNRPYKLGRTGWDHFKSK